MYHINIMTDANTRQLYSFLLRPKARSEVSQNSTSTYLHFEDVHQKRKSLTVKCESTTSGTECESYLTPQQKKGK